MIKPLPPVKLDIDSGAEWLLPVAKRWLAHGKSVVGRIGSKFCTLPGGEQVTLTWTPWLEYIRIKAIAIGKIVGFSYDGYGPGYIHTGYVWDSGVRTDMIADASISGVQPFKVSGDGSIAAGNATLLAYPHWTRAFRWDIESNVETIADSIITGIVPRAGTTIPAYVEYRSTYVTDMSTDGSIILGYRSPGTGLFPEAFLWTANTGPVMLGFLEGMGTLPPYGYDIGNKSYPYCMSEDGSVVFGSSGGESFFNGGNEAYVGCRWTAATGWTRLPTIYARTPTIYDWPVTAIRTNNIGNMTIGSTYDGTKNQPYMWSEANGAEILPQPWESLGVVTSTLGVSPSGKYIIGTIDTGRSCSWEIDQETYAITATEIPLHTPVAVLNDGTVYGYVESTTPGKFIPAKYTTAGLVIADEDPTYSTILTDASPAGAVGYTGEGSPNGVGTRGFFWSRTGGPLQFIDTLPVNPSNIARAISGGSNG